MKRKQSIPAVSTTSAHPVDVAIRKLEAARLRAKRRAEDATFAAQIPDLPW